MNDNVPIDRLKTVAALHEKASSVPNNNGHGSTVSSGRSRLSVGVWLKDRGIEFKEKPKSGRTVFELSECPFDRSHNRGEACITQEPSGRLGFRCHHNSCSERNWHDAKKKIGPRDPQHWNPPLGSRSNQPSSTTEMTPGTRVRAGDRENFGVIVSDSGSQCMVHFQSPTGEVADKLLPKSQLTVVDGSDQNGAGANSKTYFPDWLSARDFAETEYIQQYLVKRVLVRDQPMVIGGKSKTLKTCLATDLVVSLGSGTKFLMQFDAIRAKVAFLSGESGGFVVQETAKRICSARGIKLADVDAHFGFDLPQLARRTDMDTLADAIVLNGIEVIIIDPAYLCLLGGDVRGRNSANIFDMGPLLLELTQVGQETNCTVVLIHHCRKNTRNPFSPPELEELSMAGIGEWARQWMLLGRRDNYQQGSGLHHLWLNTGGSAGHSGMWAVDIDEGQLQDDFTGCKWDVKIGSAEGARDEVARRKEQQKVKEQRRKEDEHGRKLLNALGRYPDGETARVLRDTAGLNSTNFGPAITTLLKEGRAETCEIRKKTRTYDGFKPTGK